MLTLAEIMRASNVARWGIVNVSKPQSVAEHTFNVTMMVRALCKRLGVDDDVLIKAALEHDLDEVIYGDMPSPMKAEMKAKGVDVNELVGNKMRELTPQQEGILKVCDLLESVVYLKDHAIGKHAREVTVEVESRMKEYVKETEGLLLLQGPIHIFIKDVIYGQA